MKGDKMYYVIYKNSKYKQPYWWVAKSDGNHETLCSSEMLSSKQACLNSMQLVSREADTATYIDKTGE